MVFDDTRECLLCFWIPWLALALTLMQGALALREIEEKEKNEEATRIERQKRKLARAKIVCISPSSLLSSQQRRANALW
jgi:hypothetical protein